MKIKNKSGFSLIEIMVAVLLLTVLALGGAAILYQTGGSIQVQGNKRIAIEMVNELLEVAQNADYISFADYETTRTYNGVTYTLYTDITVITNLAVSPIGMRRDVLVRLAYKGEEISVNSIVIQGLGIQ